MCFRLRQPRSPTYGPPEPEIERGRWAAAPPRRAGAPVFRPLARGTRPVHPEIRLGAFGSISVSLPPPARTGDPSFRRNLLSCASFNVVMIMLARPGLAQG